MPEPGEQGMLAQTTEECREACLAHDACEIWVWMPSRRLCWLMRGALGITPRKDRFVGGRGESLRTAYTCEGNAERGTGTLRLDCPAGAGTLRIAAAMYGRLETTTCPHKSVDEVNPDESGLVFSKTAGENTRRCHAPVHLALAESACNGKQRCILRADNKAYGGDPCPGLRKYLAVVFTCSNIGSARRQEQKQEEGQGP